jgi:Ala-tRNA(Pro) deacylase
MTVSPPEEASMATALSIEAFLRGKRVPYTTFRHPVAYSAQGEAAASHVRGRDWAKTIACFVDGEPVLAVLPAPFHVNLDALRRLAGAREARLAHEDEVATLYPGCEIGAMSPLGPLYHQRVFADAHLGRDSEIVFNGGTHADAVRMHYEDFREIARPVVGAFAAPSA